MFSLASLTLLFAVASALPIPSHHRRNAEHSVLAKRLDDSLEARGTTFTANRVTWYGLDTGPDACTGKNHKDSDNFVALNMPQWGNRNGRSSYCGKKIRITANGVTAIGIIQDACATCYNTGEIDLTRSLFQKFASLDKGVFKATWSLVDDNAPPPPDQPKPDQPKQTKTKTKTKTKTTPTPEKTPIKNETTKKPSPTKTKHLVEAPPTPPPQKPATTKQPPSEPTTTLLVDDGDDEEWCDEYEDDASDDATETETPAPKPTPPAPKPAAAKPPVAPPIVVNETPKKVNPPAPSSSTSTFSTAAFVPPTDPVADPGAAPTQSPIGGVSQNSKNAALSLSGNKVLMSIVTIALIAFQTL